MKFREGTAVLNRLFSLVPLDNRAILRPAVREGLLLLANVVHHLGFHHLYFLSLSLVIFRQRAVKLRLIIRSELGVLLSQGIML